MSGQPKKLRMEEGKADTAMRSPPKKSRTTQTKSNTICQIIICMMSGFLMRSFVQKQRQKPTGKRSIKHDIWFNSKSIQITLLDLLRGAVSESASSASIKNLTMFSLIAHLKSSTIRKERKSAC